MTTAFFALLPATVVCSETGLHHPPLRAHPDELTHIATAAASRRREFIAARSHAHHALARLGRPAQSILRGRRGEPLWPEGVIGSITHCRGHQAAAVALSSEALCLGIDAEPNLPLPEGVLTLILSTGVDPRALRDMETDFADRDAPVCSDRLLFSAKEAVYKAWYPIARQWLDFHQVTICFTSSGSFIARIHPSRPMGVRHAPTTLRGRWSADRSIIRTAVFSPHLAC